MQRVGDDSAGFSVDHPAPDRILVKAWGFWGAVVAAAFEPTVSAACLSWPRGAVLILDMSDVKPMREEGQRSLSQLLRSLPRLGVSRVSIVTTNPLAKLQLLRLVAENRTGTPVEWIAGSNELARSG